MGPPPRARCATVAKEWRSHVGLPSPRRCSRLRRVQGMRHVLFVDGQPELRGVAQRALAASGTYRVSCAGGGDQALPVLERNRPDLVVVDAAIPGLSGIDLVAHAA